MRVLGLHDPGYPPLLALLSDAPAELWFRGDPALLSRVAVAIVGSRAATRLGLEMAEKLAAGLAREGVVVVSGCARGIDAAAHRAALDVGGTTIGVLAGGLDVAAPPLNRPLAERIARRGLLVSEHRAGVTPRPYLFPLRNRIIAGLTRVVVVVEAAARSGALTTARHALDAGREVMVVPTHPLLPNAAGIGMLLRDGAGAAFGVEDVLVELAGLPPVEGLAPWTPGARARSARARALPPSAPLNDRIAAALEGPPARPEEVAAFLGEGLPAILAGLTELELIGVVRMVPGPRFGIVPRRTKE